MNEVNGSIQQKIEIYGEKQIASRIEIPNFQNNECEENLFGKKIEIQHASIKRSNVQEITIINDDEKILLMEELKKLKNEKTHEIMISGKRTIEVEKSGEFQISSPASEFLVVAVEGLGRVLPSGNMECLDLMMEETMKKGKNAVLKEYHMWMKLKIEEFMKFTWKENLIWNERKTKLISCNPTLAKNG